MLVVVAIIGILAGLVTAAAIAARKRAKIATVGFEIKQLEAACESYKAKFGEYPPDFSGDLTTAAAQNIILRHLAKAFPRYIPGVPTGGGQTGFNGFLADVKAGWGLDPTSNDSNYVLSPETALTFWLGGCPQWKPSYAPTDPNTPVTSFAGFAADPTNPFSPVATCPSRIPPFYDFNLTSLYFKSGGSRSSTPPVVGGLMAWPSTACDKTQNPLAPLAYFRAENSCYTVDGTAAGTIKTVPTPVTSAIVVPAVDSRLTTGANYVWINPQSIQIFCSGLDGQYAAAGKITTPLQFPSGANYQPQTFDDITNFCTNGTLDDSRK